MSYSLNRFGVFADEKDIDLNSFTSNPKRKYLKLLRKKNAQLIKNSNPKLIKEIEEIKKKLDIYTPNTCNKTKKPRFKKIKIDKAAEFKKRREKEERERKSRYNNKYKNWYKKTYKEAIDIVLPDDISSWMNNINKVEYYKLMKKYHPDKNPNIDTKFCKFITNYWNEHQKTL